MSTTLSSRGRLAGMIGNLLAHYDTALFGLLAPFIAPLFFETSDPLTALILTYGILPLGTITKPVGALFFGWMGDRFGRKRALLCSLVTMASATVLMGMLPTYHQAGILAPCLLALGRMVQSFCSGGESIGAAIFVLEHTPLAKRSLVSSVYDASSMSGILIASGVVTFLCSQGWMEAWWRLPFWIGGITAIFGIVLRGVAIDVPVVRSRLPWAPLQALKEHRGALLSIVLTSGFSYATYSLAFTLMNGFVPLVTALSKSDVMKVNTGLLAVDMLLLPCFGYLAHKYGKEKIMLMGAFCSALWAIPLFYCLDGAGIATVTAVRFFIVFFGVAFSAPYHAWKLERVPVEHRSTILSFGCALGSQLIGVPTAVIGLWLYKQLGYVWAPGLYLMLTGMLAWGVVYLHTITDAKAIASRSQKHQRFWNRL